MWKKFTEYWEYKSKNGIDFFYANDKTEGKPSSTLFYAYISFWVSICSLIALHFSDRFQTATTMSFILTAMTIIFYMIRKINKASVNLKDKSVSLENNEGDKK